MSEVNVHSSVEDGEQRLAVIAAYLRACNATEAGCDPPSMDHLTPAEQARVTRFMTLADPRGMLFRFTPGHAVQIEPGVSDPSSSGDDVDVDLFQRPEVDDIWFPEAPDEQLHDGESRPLGPDQPNPQKWIHGEVTKPETLPLPDAGGDV